MSNFKSNFSKFKMLANEKIEVKINDVSFQMNYPTLRTLENDAVSFFIGFLEKDISEIEKMITGYEFKTHFKLIGFLSIIGPKVGGDLSEIANLVMNGMKYFIPDLDFSRGYIKIKGEVLNQKIFDELVQIIFKMFDKEFIIIKEEDDKFTRREKEAKIRVQRIRSNPKNKKGEGQGIEPMLAGILYEFPQYTLEDLFDLNLYTIYYLFKYIGRIANYEISKIAYGNGLMKKGKHKHFIEN